ncbi:hypothetical protein B7R22_13150 [Subtercola boreus]|uniref:Uncharacterized protein n=1 Tax=Subtercola boreus TaxID=120213 RepID=A0A3E0VUS6_9MICO|nr:PIN domain-containing protein [Subtercola boreus]RFA13596.1 hypothetical protein B7R22_13150 [Subtercola boreus]
MSTYLVDNSIWQKAGRSARISRRLREISTFHVVMTCPPQVLEYCHSARSEFEYFVLRGEMGRLFPAGIHPSEADSLDIQEALWSTGRVRAAAAFDCLIAAYAIRNDAIVLNSDRDFGHIADAVGPEFRQEYVPE